MDILINGGPFLAPMLTFKKPFACACPCACRPELEVFDAQNQYHSGFVKNPFKCCGMNYFIHAGEMGSGPDGADPPPVLEVHGEFR